MNSDILITVISTALASSGFWAFFQSRLQARDAEKSKDSAEKCALLGILHQELKRECKRYIDKGEIHINEYEDLRKYVYEPYKKLGGNGTGEEWMDMVSEILKQGGHNHE